MSQVHHATTEMNTQVFQWFKIGTNQAAQFREVAPALFYLSQGYVEAILKLTKKK